MATLSERDLLDAIDKKDIECIKRLFDLKCPYNEDVIIERAVITDDVDVLTLVYKCISISIVISDKYVFYACRHDKVNVLQYLIVNMHKYPTNYAMKEAIRKGSIKCLKYLKPYIINSNEKRHIMETAASAGHLDAIVYLKSIGLSWYEEVTEAATSFMIFLVITRNNVTPKLIETLFITK